MLQANSLVKGLKERFPDAKPWNVELFGGSPDDNNAFFFYDGAMSVLQPLIDDGSIVIPSGQMGMDVVGTLRWLPATAQARMDNLLSANYTDTTLHGVLSPYDGLSIGILSSLKGVGYGSADLPMPIVTGQDAEVPSVKSILADEQYSTVFKDTRELAKVTVGMVNALLAGGTPEINDTKTYDNGVKVVPSYLLVPMEVDKTNWEAAAGRVPATTPRTRSSKTGHRPGRAFGPVPSAGERTECSQFSRCAASPRRFRASRALDNVNLVVMPGEIHALVGENGAGKSTLMKVLSGVYPHGTYEGDILYEGEVRSFRDLADSEHLGIVIIHQELALVPLLSIAENIFLGNEVATKRRHRLGGDLLPHRASCWRRSGSARSPTALVTDIGVGKQQLVEIAKALSKRVKLLILDEPTASLQETDSQALLDLLLEFKAQGITSILISHKLNEISRVADRITVLRDGATVSTLDTRAETVSEDHIIRDMVGRSMSDRYPHRDPEDRRGAVRGRGLERLPPGPLRPAADLRRRLQRARRRDRRHRRPDGLRPHRARHEHLRQVLRPPHHRHRQAARQADRRRHRRPGGRRRASPTSPRTARASA